MIDAKKLKREIASFVSSSRPTSADPSAPCSAGDLSRLIVNLGKLLNDLVNELNQE